MMCAGGIQGYMYNSPAVEKVLKPVVECCMKQECIEPEGSGFHNHRYDQSVFSIMLAKNGIKCQTEGKFWGNRGNSRTPKHPQGITVDPTEKNDMILFSRRGWGIEYDNNPPQFGLYVPFLKKKETEK